MRLSIFIAAVLIGGCSTSTYPKEITNSIGMKLLLIPKGTFQMGSPSSEGGPVNELQHKVTLSKDYYLGAFEVTQAQYETVMGRNPSSFKGEQNPVDQVTWKEAVEFCRRLSDSPEERAVGRVYRLPTEAEWEYACRAGSQTRYSFGEDGAEMTQYGWCYESAGQKTHPVGIKLPNSWGLYDMHGNVQEWCSDWFGDYPAGPVSDPGGPQVGSSRVFRGGSWGFAASDSRSAVRYANVASMRIIWNGFRVAMSIPSGVPQ